MESCFASVSAPDMQEVEQSLRSVSGSQRMSYVLETFLPETGEA